MSEVAFILSGTDNAAQADKVQAFLERNPRWTTQFAGVLENRGYSYNNGICHWIEGVAVGYAALPDAATDYQVMCKARNHIRNI